MVAQCQRMWPWYYHTCMLMHFVIMHQIHSVGQWHLNPILRFFLKSRNLNDPTISPKIHSTDERTELIDLLNCSMGAVRGTSRNGCCRWIRRGYAGSPYTHIASPVGLNAFLSRSSNKQESLSIAASCFLPSVWVKNKNNKKESINQSINNQRINQRFSQSSNTDIHFIELPIKWAFQRQQK